ncbi:MAG: hypothetical protein ABIH66_14780 [bacterium]
MSIRSIDLAVLYSKTSDVEKAQQAQQQQDRITQEQVAQDTSQKRIERQRQVVSNPRSEGGHIEERPERRRGKRRGQRQHLEENEEASEQETSPGKKPSIDIRI